MNNGAWLDPTLVAAIAALTSLTGRSLLAGCMLVRLHRPPPPQLEALLPISVLKPLCGVDEGLLDNLRSLATQDYPGGFELVLGVTDPADPALAVARRLQREHPEVPMSIVVGSPGAAINPKVANLVGITRAARHELLLVSDSNVRVGPDYLRRMAAELAQPGVALVGNLIAGDHERGAGGVLESLQLNGYIAGSICGGATLLGHVCVIGKSMLMRRGDLERLGGWAAFGDVLGEDYVLGQSFVRAGLGVTISSYVVRTVVGRWSTTRFVQRHLRWAQMRRWIAPRAFVLEPLLSPTPWLLTLAWCATLHDGARGASADAGGLLAVLGLAWALLLEALQSRALRGRVPSWRELAWVPFKDLAMIAIWAMAWTRRSVAWRGHEYRIGRGSRLTPVDRVGTRAVAGAGGS
ncbi:MAG: glycosyltransferase [Deltaproteobacteria bacterium]|nr:glycosyltransferase [Nannocystaceae bacterium]